MTQASRVVQPGLQSSVRSLLEQPILLEGSDGFREAMAWRMELRRFFERVAGWSVLTGPGALRLVAAPAFAGAAVGIELTQTLHIQGVDYSMIRLQVGTGSFLDGDTVGELQHANDMDIVLHGRDGSVEVQPHKAD